MNIFERASVDKLRFPSTKGELAVENLWDLPLQSKGGVDLDTIAKTVNAGLKALGEESFVSTKSNPGKAAQELRLEILKHIIGVKMRAAEDARDRAEKLAKREKLVAILDKKQNEALENLSADEIAKQIASLGE